MTQGRDGTSLAYARALKLVAVARRLSLVAAVFAVAALLAGTTGTTYAQPPTLEDSVAVSNYGPAFNGSLESFCGDIFNWLPVPCPEGANHNAKPVLRAAGPATLLGASSGAALDAVSSVDNHIAVAVPIDLVDQTCFGAPAAGVSYPQACNEYIRDLLDLPPGAPVPPAPFGGTGFAAIFTPGANGNTAPETIIGTRDAAFSISGNPDVYTYLAPTTGVNTPQGVAFESPYDGVASGDGVPGHDIVAIANTLPYVIGSIVDGNPDIGGPACTAFGGATVGSVTEFDRSTLQSGYNDEAAPFQSSLVLALNEFTIINHKKEGTTFPDTLLCSTTEPTNNYTCFGAPYVQNVTIAGCNTFLLAPVGLAFDASGFLFVVNNAVPAAPSFVTMYSPGSYGDLYPIAIVGLIPPTAGDLTSGVAVAVSSLGFEDDVMYVTDLGFPLGTKGITPATAVPPSIKIFDPIENFSTTDFFFAGELLGAIQGKSTRLNRPQGIALSQDGDTLYVVNALGNSLEMFTDVADIAGTEDLAPTLIVSGPRSQLNMPVGVALPQFTPTPEETIDALPSEAARN